ncbi:MAG: ABC transporter permease [Candidatus Latescibacteria bacterium]|nr:ABC transporter permease [Candidatus Latescibacterota bacterium]
MYSLKEAVKALLHIRSMTIVSIFTITIALIILGLLGIVTLFGHSFVDSLMKSEEINVYLKDEMSDADMLGLESAIASMSEVESTRILTKEDAARELEKMFNEDLLAGIEKNPLPRTIVITLASGHRMSEDHETVAERIRKVTNVESVEYGREWMSKMDIFFLLFILMEIILITIIVSACLLIISNTISLTVFARNETIEIMRLVGATDSFIRRPFYFEGFIQGILSGSMAFLILFGAFEWLRYAIPDLQVYLYIFGIQNFILLSHRFSMALIIPAGALMGLIGSTVAVRRAI